MAVSASPGAEGTGRTKPATSRSAGARRAAGWFNLIVSAALALLVWGLAVVFAAKPSLKKLWDVSPQARFTVEPATRQLLEQLRAEGKKLEILTIFYPPGAMRATDALGRRRVDILQRLQTLTRDLLRLYSYRGGDAVVVKDYNPLADPAKLRDALKYIENAQVNTVVLKLGKRSKVLSLELDMAEFDLPRDAPRSVPGAQQALPSIKDYKGEEAISTALKQLIEQATPKVYFLTDSRMGLGPVASSYSELVNALKDDGFEVEFWDLTRAGRMPEDADVIGLIDPRTEIPPQTADLLYDYVRRGGQLFVNVHYWEEPASWNISLDELGERFGFALSPELVCHGLVDPNNERQLRTGVPQCQNLVAVNMNPAHPVTRPLLASGRYPRFKVGREVRQRSGVDLEGVRVDTSFLRTGRGAWLEPAPVDYQPAPGDSYGPRSIGAVIDVDPSEGTRTGHVVVVAAQGFDNFSFEYNGDLALNLFNWMAEREALVSIRGRKYVSRRLELQPQQLDRIGTLLMAGVPGLLLAVGIVVFWRRRRV